MWRSRLSADARPGARSLLAIGLGLVALGGACRDKGSDSGTRRGPGESGLTGDSGETDGADGRADGADGRADGADGTDGADGADGTDPGDPVDEACYLGADRAGTTCLPVVAWSSDWGSDYTYPDPLDDRYLAPARYLDLDDPSSDPDLALAPNFTLGEFLSATKGRFGVFQPHAVQSLQWVREAIGGPVTVNSGYRSPGYNAGIDGSATWSRHMYGDAADIASADLSIDALADLCADWGAGYVGTYTTHVHCDWRDDPLSPSFYDADTAAALAPPPLPTGRIVWADPSHLSAPADGFDEGEPLRTWSAWAASGELLERATGPTYAPPAGAARVSVNVGRQLWLQASLPGS